VRIRPVDIGSDHDLERVHAVDVAANELGRPYATTWPLAEMTVTLRLPSSTRRRELFAAEDHGSLLGVGELELPLTDNPHLADVHVYVHPDHRRAGVGTALAAHLRDIADAAGRRLATTWLPGRQLWDGADPAAEEPAGERFARRCGMTLRNTNQHRVLELPVDEAVLDRLAAEAAPHHEGYRIVGFAGVCPDEYVAAYCALKAAMLSEAPMGDLEIDPEVWDEARLREEEAELDGMQRTRLSVFALTPDGEVAGFNELLHSVHDPGNAYNWDTLVVPEHRGHRLGLALKVANLRRFQPDFPDARRVHTHNAAQNGPMIAVNDRLGYFAVEEVGEWQGDVNGLPGAGT